jgi:hypothetical protein
MAPHRLFQPFASIDGCCMKPAAEREQVDAIEVGLVVLIEGNSIAFDLFGEPVRVLLVALFYGQLFVGGC